MSEWAGILGALCKCGSHTNHLCGLKAFCWLDWLVSWLIVLVFVLFCFPFPALF